MTLPNPRVPTEGMVLISAATSGWCCCTTARATYKPVNSSHGTMTKRLSCLGSRSLNVVNHDLESYESVEAAVSCCACLPILWPRLPILGVFARL